MYSLAYSNIFFLNADIPNRNNYRKSPLFIENNIINLFKDQTKKQIKIILNSHEGAINCIGYPRIVPIVNPT